ncbi:hypothetical protein [Pedobacter sp.]|uniref:hypothetical protein n=2 Tax=Sphingobacteriaceae TaxID=84566 RepID=UPI002BA7A81A|nr:hypothetical protein [Pedobacter sp.]HWW38086.1 hypothetical protein [Pedobacter sp.]
MELYNFTHMFINSLQKENNCLKSSYLCSMTKHLKIGMICMAGAVLLMPVALLLKNTNTAACIAIIIASMLLEVIGLIFVIVSFIKRKKS